jgi:2-polyprenyl-6-methoxyphenol hydroxylase-like FAD-dependent oxidoreductase
MMNAEVIDLLQESGRITGVVANTKDGPVNINALLTVGADGRNSIVRERAGLKVQVLGAPIDVLWFRLSRKPDDPTQVIGRFAGGKIMVMLNRDDYWQCGFVIPKGTFDSLKQRGLEMFHQDLVSIAPFLKGRVHEIQDWDQVKLLTVAVDRLTTWYREGLLCIGDAAHAMSPVGGVGINLAIQDAVATANILTKPLLKKSVLPADLRAVQERRLFPTQITQMMQVFIQKRVLAGSLGRTLTSAPWFLRLFRWFPILQRIPAYLIGVGARPEHVMKGNHQ